MTSHHKDLTSRNNYLTSDSRNMPPYKSVPALYHSVSDWFQGMDIRRIIRRLSKIRHQHFCFIQLSMFDGKNVKTCWYLWKLKTNLWKNDICLENQTKTSAYVSDEFKDALYLSLLFNVSPTCTCKYLNYTSYLKGNRFHSCNFV